MGHLSWVSEVLSLGILDCLDVSVAANWQKGGRGDCCLKLSWALYSSHGNSHNRGWMPVFVVGFTALEILDVS